ncbi:MAG: hypothetical protein Q8L78_04815 [Coxiellaceae bacterium]|nr:hypothetical protein [Coxiellaceae bacterium]
MKQFLLLLCLSFFLIACHGPGFKEYETANKAYVQGQYKIAFANYLYAANLDIVPAEYAVGYLYYYGLGIKRNEAQGIIWLQKAAPKSVEATYALSVIREHNSKEPWMINLK